jgi:hypothetical protein
VAVMKVKTRVFLVLAASLLLASCGGNGYTPPIVVIGKPKTITIEDRAVITSNEFYNGPPVTVNQLHDGRWLLVYRHGISHVVTTGKVTRISDDQGASWGPESVDSSPHPVYDVYVRTTPLGNLLSSLDMPGGQLYNRSTDDALTWSSPVPFDQNPGGYFVTLGFSDNTNAFMADYDAHGSAFFWESTDDGVTWTRLSEIHHADEAAITETGVAKMENGSLIAVSRDNINTNTYLHFSDDMGKTWGDAQDYTSQLGTLSLPQVMAVGSRILLLGRDHSQKQLVLFVSTDLGKTFTNRIVLDTYFGEPSDGGYCWPMLMDDGRVFVAYYANDAANLGHPNIKSLKIRLP